MLLVASGVAENPMPTTCEALHCGVSYLFAGSILLSGFSIISLSSSIFRRVRRG